MTPPKAPTLAERMDGWPWTKTFAAVCILVFAGTAFFSGLAMLAMLWVEELRPSSDREVQVLREIYAYYEATLQWSAAGATGGLLVGVGKRLSAKPEMITAEAEAARKLMASTDPPPDKVTVGDTTITGATGEHPAPGRARVITAPAAGTEGGGALAGDDERDDEEEAPRA